MKMNALIRDTRGANLLEYILLVGVIAIVGAAGFAKFGTAIKDKVGEQSTSAEKVNGNWPGSNSQ